MGRLDNKVAFITGVARGQGRSHAVRFAEEGADIIGIDVVEQQPYTKYKGATPEDAEETIRLVEALGRRIHYTKADVRSYDQVKAAVDAGVDKLGRLDIVVANAGIDTSGHVLADAEEDLWGDMLDVNLSGVWRTVKASIPHIRAGGAGGSIMMTSSAAGLRAYPNIGHYVTAKHGIVGLMRAFALELAPESIRVNSIHPTQVNTDMIQNEAMYRLFSPDVEPPTNEAFAVASMRFHPLPVPWVEPLDISNAALFLASDESRYITGTTLAVDAGGLLI